MVLDLIDNLLANLSSKFKEFKQLYSSAVTSFYSKLLAYFSHEATIQVLLSNLTPIHRSFSFLIDFLAQASYFYYKLTPNVNEEHWDQSSSQYSIPILDDSV